MATDTVRDVDLFPFDDVQPVLVLHIEGRKEPLELRIGHATVAKLACLAVSLPSPNVGEWSDALQDACETYLAERKP